MTPLLILIQYLSVTGRQIVAYCMLNNRLVKWTSEYSSYFL